MKVNHESWKDRVDNEILFSRVVKAGKRVYYIDVKRDRRDEFYISMTESKRVKEGTEDERPVFEKHKIFLYREDMLKFLTALTDTAQFVGEHRPLTGHNVPVDDYSNEEREEVSSETTPLNSGFDIEF